MGRPSNTLENDKSGLKLGRLTVIHPVFRQTGKVKRVFYKCQCECGNEFVRRGDFLVKNKNNTHSCGCWQKEMARELKSLGESEGFFKRAWSGYKSNSKRKLIPFELTLQRFKELVVLDCYYCGSQPSRKDTIVQSNTSLINGIDRIIPHMGYVEGNMVTCCFPCNQRKSNDDKENFINWIKKTYNYLASRGEIST